MKLQAPEVVVGSIIQALFAIIALAPTWIFLLVYWIFGKENLLQLPITSGFLILVFGCIQVICLYFLFLFSLLLWNETD